MSNVESRIESLEKAVRLQTAQIASLESDKAELLERLESIGRPKTQPFLELIPDLATITKIRAELFNNPPRQGKPAQVLKLFVWTCPKNQVMKFQQGNVQPFFIYMDEPKKFKPGDGSSDAEDLVRAIGDEPDYLLGCLNQRKKHGDLKGQRRYPNSGALIRPDGGLALFINGRSVEFGGPVPLREGRSERASQRVWYVEP